MNTRFGCFLVLIVVAVSLCGGGRAEAQFSDPRAGRGDTVDPACHVRTLVSTGGPFPRDDSTLVIRWAGYANFELVYRDQVILLDAHFDRGSNFPPLGFHAADVTRADLILIGHGHSDHMSDAASVGARTGAMVVGASVTTAKLAAQSLAPEQIRTVTGRGGERLEFRGFTVEPILARHGAPPRAITDAFRTALRSVTPDPTPTEVEERARIGERRASDPRIGTEGTIAYLITLDNGFNVLFRDSGGRVTEHERAAAERVGSVSVMLAPTAAAYLNTLTVEQALEYVTTYKPTVFIPAHHDAPYNNLWRATEPMFQAIADVDPSIVTVSRTYREPVCFDTEARFDLGR